MAMSEKVKYLNDGNFNEEIGSGVTLVDFYADWCGPCKMITPIINELADEMDGQAKVAKLDIDTNQGTTASFNVTSVPTLILFKNGQEVNRVVGVKDKESLKALIASAA
ncbi:MAG: thioredoxin [Chlamydiia bacterium]|nr:thioredoxin [Chlamydiia bacterium]